MLGFSMYQFCLTASVPHLGAAPAGDCRRHSNGLRVTGVALCTAGMAQGNQAKRWPHMTPSHGHQLWGSPFFMLSASPS